jgi:hypothetical protein
LRIAGEVVEVSVPPKRIVTVMVDDRSEE